MARLSTSTSRSLREFRLLPGFTASDAAMPKVSLETPLCRDRGGFLRIRSPIVGAAMRAVTGRDMAVGLAQLGGIGVLPVSQSIEEQCAAVAAVKRFKAGFQHDLHTLAPAQGIAQVVSIIEETGYTSFPVTDTGLFHGRLDVGTDPDPLPALVVFRIVRTTVGNADHDAEALEVEGVASNRVSPTPRRLSHQGGPAMVLEIEAELLGR